VVDLVIPKAPDQGYVYDPFLGRGAPDKFILKHLRESLRFKGDPDAIDALVQYLRDGFDGVK